MHLTTPIYACISLLLHISQAPIQWTPQKDNRDALQDAQRGLLATSATRPELALQVGSLEWEIQPLSNRWIWPLREEDKLELDEMFNTFWLFLNVTNIHLVFSTDYIPVSLPPVLFPRVTSVKLTSASLDIANSILHSPTQVTELSIETRGNHETYISLLQWLAATPFPSLRKLSLRYGPVPADDDREGSKRVKKVFAAWREILISSRETLQEVLLGFKDPMPTCLVRKHRPGIAPVLESRFMKMVGPVFTQKKWPELRILELEGVTKSKGLWDYLEAAIPLLAMCHERQMIIESWDPDAAAKF